MNKKIFTFGEIMLRVSPQLLCERIPQANLFKIEPGGSESNVAIALAQLGYNTSFLTRIPDTLHKDLILKYLKGYGVDTSYISIGGDKIGSYWTENGIGPRPTNVIYDREGSSFYDVKIKDFDWDQVNKNADWFHISGITPAISENLYKNTSLVLDMLNKNIKLSVDLNYRDKLWRWINENRKDKIEKIMTKLCSRAYLITGNESDLCDVFGFSISKPGDIASYKKIAKVLFDRIKTLRYLALSLRECHCASENDWGGILFVRKDKEIKSFSGLKYTLLNIVDRVGTGDSFTAGIIHRILHFKNNSQQIIDFAVSLSALNHTVRGDASQFSVRDVEEVMKTKGSGRIIR